MAILFTIVFCKTRNRNPLTESPEIILCRRRSRMTDCSSPENTSRWLSTATAPTAGCWYIVKYEMVTRPLNLPILSDAAAATTEISQNDHHPETDCRYDRRDWLHQLSPPKPHPLPLCQPSATAVQLSVTNSYNFVIENDSIWSRFFHILVKISRFYRWWCLHQFEIGPRHT